MKNLFAIIFLFLSLHVWGKCEVDSAHTIFSNASYQWGTSFSYLPQGRSFEENPRIKISGCDRESAQRKLLMIGLGADYFGGSSDTVGVSYNGELHPDTCRIQDSLFKVTQTFEEKKKLYADRTNFINSCVNLVVRHAGERKLKNIVSDECLIEEIDGNTAYIKGGYCFFRIYTDSFFEVTSQISEACTDKDFLNWLNISPMEVFAHANFFIAGDASGVSEDLTPLKSISLRFNLEPEERLVSVSESYSGFLPRWPDQWVLPDIHQGEISIKKVGSKISLKPTLIVDNRCQKRCFDGLCSSPCSYATPVSGKYSLYLLKNGERDLVLDWYDGAIVPPSWQGVVPVSFQNLGELKINEGERYQLVYEMNDPKEDFVLFSKQAGKQKLRLPGLRFSELDLSQGIPEIRTDWDIGTIDSIPPLSGITDKNSLYAISDFDLGVGTLQDFYYWPPYYREVCDQTLINCLPPDGRSYLFLSTTFTVESSEGRSYKLSNFMVERSSPLLKSYRKRVEKMPALQCKTL